MIQVPKVSKHGNLRTDSELIDVPFMTPSCLVDQLINNHLLCFWSFGHLSHTYIYIYYIIHMDAGLAEAAAFGMGFKGAGSCKCRTAYEIIVPNEEKAACFVQFHQVLVICHMSPRSFKDGGRKNGTSKFPAHSALAP